MKFSLIIPAFNAEKNIASCLESALNQSLPREKYEIIVVDDGSEDSTSAIAGNYPVKLIRQNNMGPAAARNRGAGESLGDVLIFTDSDCEPDRRFLEHIVAPIVRDPEIVGVQGSYRTRQMEFMARFGQVEIESRYGKMQKNETIDFIGAYAAAYEKKVFFQHGGFDPGFPSASGEDTELSYKLSKAGHKLVFNPEAVIFHQHPTKLSRYLKTKFYRGYWRIRLYRKHPEKTVRDSYTPQSLKLQVLSAPLFFFWGIISIFHGYSLWPLSLLIFFFVLFSIPFFKVFRERRYPNSLFLPAVLFLRAFFLFLGMLGGCINELKRKK